MISSDPVISPRGSIFNCCSWVGGVVRGVGVGIVLSRIF